MNSINLIGNLVNEPKVYGQNGKVIKFMVAVQRPFKDKQTGEYESDFIPCIAFSKTAEIISNNFSKGSKIGITGRWQSGRFDKDGQTVYTNDCVVENVTFIERKSKQQNQKSNQSFNAKQPVSQDDNPFENTDISSDPLPF
ncbi:single-stranded DNA-binding protein [Staphylococcus pettenkoferi]|uniref:single-stranded DNA-binding protein n=1 Tax=Staphylococcus pettenkoferi TaxID=170573 RepID=UPI000CD1F875|nr:single-stranded DNA-binding protein [Staphylococcus pettenkoferi]MCY1585616.1 single-stranded DNA-binding protein [Staphylococcus pettenkoferi]PNZ87674.1 single-stranded DNA-binding protein [Staphylococcus pettenkoferi]QQC36815.1 single-stranded DNA-binding protein [Staphylococcus pettenkoferi]